MNDDRLKLERSRFIALNAIRITGAILMLFGLAVISRGFLELPVEVGYGAFGIGVIEFIVMPVMLARAWSTPKDL